MKVHPVEKRLLRRTYSLCPACLRRIPARLVAVQTASGEEVYLEKTCERHGGFSAVVWRGKQSYRDWVRYAQPLAKEPVHCPESCGICAGHRKGTCCVLIEVTDRCDLGCRFCFAEGGREHPSLEKIAKTIRGFVRPGETFLQISGGEPTMREDLPAVIRAAKELGCRYIQLNTNGLRLAGDPSYAALLKQAGLSFVFLQFDGTADAVYRALRGRPLLAEKTAAIENCGAAGLGVTLVPTVVPGINDGEIGDIIRFGVARSPVVRGVHFQPVSYLGRCPETPSDADRFTLGELVDAVLEQSGGMIGIGSLSPSRCDHPQCGFHGSYLVSKDRRLIALKRAETGCRGTTAEENRAYVGRRWTRDIGAEESCCTDDIGSFEGFVNASRARSFTVSAMAFQDCYTVDLARVMECSLHVADGGRMMPFCIRYLTGADGRRLSDG